VGVAIYEPGVRPKYLAWAHPTENNCTKQQAVNELKRLYSTYTILCHHAKFDLDVGQVHMGVGWPKNGFHDSEYLAFLYNPYEQKLALKPLAEKYLDMPPEEQNKLRDWIMAHVPEAKGKPKTWKDWGHYICRAPGKLVGKYAIGDVVRTYKLLKFYYKRIKETGMLNAYERDLTLMPILLENETGGVRIAERRLGEATREWQAWIDESDQWLRKRLKTPDLDVNSSEQLADALEYAGAVSEWIYTAPSKTYPNGQRSTAKDNIIQCIDDKQVLTVLNYRGTLANAYRNFGRPWYEMAANNNGFIHTDWNQVRSTDDRGKGGAGARTGRLSSSPNFQNIPKNPPKLLATLPAALRRKVGELPYLRDYIVPDIRGHTLLNRDYSQQELRILGHFEDAILLEEYNKNPGMDIHETARLLINKMLAMNLDRKILKTMGFGLIYGMGLGKLAEDMGVDVRTAKQIKSAYLDIFPGLKNLTDELKQCGRNDEPIRTWGGRLYHVEPPRVIKGRLRTFEYKLLNYLIQGSAADCTKQAMINYDQIKKEGRLLLNVHDELMLSVPTGAAKQEMKLLKEAMEAVEFDVPMLSDGKSSTVSWGKMKPWRDTA
jgi:DNA polymerase-1